MIKNYEASFYAGEVKTFEISGNYFEVLGCLDNITVVLQDRNGVNKSELTNVGVSYFERLEEKQTFERVLITSATAQTVAFVIAHGQGGTRTMGGTVKVVNDEINQAVQNKSFCTSAHDRYNTAVATKLYMATAFKNETGKPVAIDKLWWNYRTHTLSANEAFSGEVYWTIESLGAAESRFNFIPGKLCNSLRQSTSIGGSYSSSGTTPGGLVGLDGLATGSVGYLPENYATANHFDLTNAPLIVPDGCLLAITKKLDGSLSGDAVIIMNTLFSGRILTGSIVPDQ